MLTPGDIQTLTIEKPAAGGRMIARANGQIVLVSGAIPGERVRLRIEKVGKGVAYAETVEVEEPSSSRREAWADPLCGGCAYGHIEYSRQLAIKAQVIADAFARIGRMPLASPVAVAASPEDGYRMRARLHVRGGRLGFFREGTHDVCDARQTRQLLPSTSDALDRLAAALGSPGAEAVRDLELAENVDASDRVVYLDAASAIDAATLQRLAAIEGFTGVVTAFGAEGETHVTDRITVPDTSDVSDVSDVSEVSEVSEVSGFVTVALRRHVQAFFQGNRHLLGRLVSHVVGQVPRGASVVDLYAGAGLFSVSAAAARGVQVVAVEGDRIGAADLAGNAAQAGGALIAVHQSVERFVESRSFTKTDAVIVDPPRTGLSREALDGIVRVTTPILIYVSCDVATLARDARRLVDAGYAIDRLDAFDLFPNTPHVETVVVFRVS